MGYMLLIVEPRGQRAERSEAEGRQVYEQMKRFAGDLQSRGKLIACESLAADREGARVQVREGRTRLLDGPFAEAKEMIGGFFLLDVDTREEALEIAAACPAAQWCTVEVRRAAPCYE
ncbi:YciI family protein [Bordetella genomosp. 9]|uniref:Dehydrogenase n=1 Tax=Bordetella genomosp. 9 TaxID=1416803 RepID=A0A1W6YWM7_9BORD|nr:YciI family protein [Bordetella genomosp. 9]ARP85497.1 dehydrogenase [Bordetella genomosp. 9]ARP89473.1 dehydrogenase [Bordetella genomosp. 9]